MFPRASNAIIPMLVKCNRQLQEMGWVKKYMDYVFIGSSSTDAPLHNMLSRERLLVAMEYAMRNSLDESEDIKFKVVEKVTPMVTEMGMGLIMESKFIQNLANALGFSIKEAFFMLMATPAPGSMWGPEQIRTGVRVFEDPDDGMFHCDMNHSQWSIGVFNKSQPEILHAVVDLEMFIPAIYTKIELERLQKEKQAKQTNSE